MKELKTRVEIEHWIGLDAGSDPEYPELLADLAPDVESALPFVSAVDAEDGLAAARTLGLPAELMPPYWRRRLQERTELTR